MINKFDIEYANVVGRVLDNGTKRMDRTGVGTIADFGFQMRFDVGKQFPMLTTKKVHWKSIATELLWFISGDTNIRYLEDNGVTIWREWADQDGFLGPVYGAQWVSWNGEVNQLSDLLYGLRNDPFSRRHIVSAWNVTELDKMALAPCHMMFQCFVSESESGTKRLSMQVYQRSADLFLGVPFNIPSYALLLSMIAQQVDMEPHHLVYVLGDTHIYLNHMDQINEQLSRAPISNTLQLNLRKAQSIDGYTLDDIELLGYNHHPAIKAPVAV